MLMKSFFGTIARGIGDISYISCIFSIIFSPSIVGC